MVRPGRDRLSGTIEVDETYVGGKKPGKRGRGAEGKALVGIAVEDKGEEKIGRIRLWLLEDASTASLSPFVQGVTQPGSTIRTDDWLGYNFLTGEDFRHVVCSSNDLKLVHLAPQSSRFQPPQSRQTFFSSFSRKIVFQIGPASHDG